MPSQLPYPHHRLCIVPAVCRILCSNVRGLARNLSDLTVASSQYDILLCSETLVSDMRHVSEVLVPGFGRPVLLCQGKMPHAVGWLHTFEMVTEHFVNPNLSVVVAKCCFLGCVHHTAEQYSKTGRTKLQKDLRRSADPEIPARTFS